MLQAQATTTDPTTATTNRKPRGEAIAETAMMLALLDNGATVVMTAADESVSDWETSAPRGERDLLTAEESRDESAAERIATASLVWLAVRGMFRRRGRNYTQKEVLESLDFYLTRKRAGVAAALFSALREGAMTAKEVQLLGERELLKAHLASAMLAKGGRAQVSLADAGRVAELLSEELGYWAERMQKIAAGQPLDGRVLQSFRAFFSAPATTFQIFEGAEMEKRGFDLWRNRLNDGLRHCEPSGGRPSCAQLSRKFVPLSQRVLRGRRACYWHCGCGDEYKNSQTGEVRR